MLISVIVPAYNEALNLALFHKTVAAVAATLPSYDFEFLFVDDGSADATPEVLARLRAVDPRVKVLRFSRNFGSHAACLAGLMHAAGDVSVFLPADLQDPPELIPQMLAKVEAGCDVVLAVRESRDDSRLTVRFANLYHALMRRYAIPGWPAQGADVFMLTRAVRDVIVRWRQKNTSIFAQMLWVGFRQGWVSYHRRGRNAGQSKWTLRKKIKLLVDSFVSFSFAPIRLMSYLGISLCGVGLACALVALLSKLGWLRLVLPAWAPIAAILSLLAGVQMIALGVIGEYLWRVADEVRGSPPFVIDSSSGIEDSASAERERRRESIGSKQDAHRRRALRSFR